MNYTGSKWGIMKLSLLLIMTLIIGRLVAGGLNFSHFISAGSDFVNPAKVNSNIKVSEGQGYDGQFFYRLALNPFEFSKEYNGITLDYPQYRSQRIMYPFIGWITSLGGYPSLVPFTLVFVNLLAFLGTVFFFKKISEHYNRGLKFQLLVFFIFGMYFSVSKDLSEVTEIFFFTGAIWFMLINKWWLFTLFSTLMLLTRETSLIALLPISTYFFLKNKPFSFLFSLKLIIPFAVFATWKYYIYLQTGSFNQSDGLGNFTYPFQGILPGLKANLDLSTSIKKLQLVFWLAYFLWQLWFVILVLFQINKIRQSSNLHTNLFIMTYLVWFVFAIFLSESIYADDWSFVRVFTLWNMVGLLVLCLSNYKPQNLFYKYSVVLLLITVIRLIIK